MKHLSLFGLLLLCAVLVACQSVRSEADVPPDKTVAELTQLAQTAYDDGHVAESELYYRIIQKRYYDDLPSRLAAEFELAHIKVKQKKWHDALPLLQTVLSYYDGIQAYSLPQSYFKLATADLAKIPENIRNK
jgi:outer membrane protein assembly factor BamD (BamD/ComL family)